MKKTQFDLTTSSPNFLDESIEILKDYIYSNRACYFITLSPLDEEVLLFYTNSKQFDKSRELSIIPPELFEDVFSFVSKRILVAYHNADGVFVDAENEQSLNHHREIYEKTKKESEIVSIHALDDLSNYEYVLLGRKVLWLSSNDDVPSTLNNVQHIKVDVKSIISSKNWIEEYDKIKMSVMISDFDVAFVKLGVLSTPLCHFISQTLSKIAIGKGD